MEALWNFIHFFDNFNIDNFDNIIQTFNVEIYWRHFCLTSEGLYEGLTGGALLCFRHYSLV